MTPIRRQYLKIKSAYPGSILLFRMGDFYETFDDDARLASRELEITLTSRSMGKDLRVPMAGVPAHSIESYLARLVKKGHQVAICEQLTDPAVSKGLVDRDVVRVVTPGTVLESALLERKVNNYLAAVAGAGPAAGLAYVDITTGEFAATQLGWDQVPLELERIGAAEVLVAVGVGDGAPPEWAPRVGAVLTEVDAASFDFQAARESLLSHYRVLTLESFGCEDRPLAVAAAGAIVDYLSRTQPSVSRNGAEAPGRVQLQNLSVYSTASYMTLDAGTRRNLELFEGGRGGEKELSLLAALDRTRTAMGGRLMRQWLGQPLLEIDPLEQRLDAVDRFFGDGIGRSAVAGLLDKVADLERIMGRVTVGSATPRDLLALRAGLETVPGLRASLETAEGEGSGAKGTLDWLRDQLVPAPEAAALIEAAIDPDPSGDVGQGGVVRSGFSPELDELKAAAAEARRYIAGLEQKERERTGIRNLRVGYNQVFGYYLEVSKNNVASLPEDYIRRQTLTHSERYIVPELKEYESVVLTARERLEEAERAVYHRVCAQLAGSAPAIIRLAGAIARVDVFSGLAQAAVDNDYVRPQLNTGPAIVIKDGRHPVVERVLGPGQFVANDVALANDGARVVVLTGPNMAGKSTYIRQVALITLMAQVGSFVPASECVIGLADRIFTRVGLQDDLATGQSTFMVEMVETAAILNQATPRSLVILDEIGRGTSTYDGLSIARAVIEHLHNDPRLSCKTLFATHYHELTELAAHLPGVRNFSVAVVEEGNEVAFLHRIVPGGADKSYGVHVARLAGLPRGVVNRAWEVLSELESHNGAGRRAPIRPAKAPGQQMALFTNDSALADRIRELDIPNLTPLEALHQLYELQKEVNSQG